MFVALKATGCIQSRQDQQAPVELQSQEFPFFSIVSQLKGWIPTSPRPGTEYITGWQGSSKGDQDAELLMGVYPLQSSVSRSPGGSLTPWRNFLTPLSVEVVKAKRILIWVYLQTNKQQQRTCGQWTEADDVLLLAKMSYLWV